MAAWVKRHLRLVRDDAFLTWRANQAVADFCFKYPDRFVERLATRAGLKPIHHSPRHASSHSEQLGFVERLAGLPGECVFLLRDAYLPMRHYMEATGSGFGIIVNRPLLFDREEQYLEWVALLYEALDHSSNHEQFVAYYDDVFSRALQDNPALEERARDIAAYVRARCFSSKITFVDLGFQFTLALFCSAAVRRFYPELSADVFCFATYPWLHERFADRVFCEKSECVIRDEVIGLRAFRNDVQDRAAGAIVGFAIGDALGAPFAGMSAEEVPTDVTRFTTNLRHPYFGDLIEGQVTSNSLIMKLVAEHLTESREFNISKFAAELMKTCSAGVYDQRACRWIGPTTREALRNLAGGAEPSDAGVRTTNSVAGAYRSIPIGIYYRWFARTGVRAPTAPAVDAARVTHNSRISTSAAAAVASIVGDLVHGNLPQTAIQGALRQLGELDDGPEALASAIRRALELVDAGTSIETARSELGTGSPAHQSLPLAVFCLLRYTGNFSAAVIAAANSFRRDSPAERIRLSRYTWLQQLDEAKGGNTDGIAGLTGSFAGAQLGLRAIPHELAEGVEGAVEFAELGRSLLK